MDQPSGPKSTITLAGISGNLGRRLARALVAEGADVRALIRSTSREGRHYASEFPGLTCVEVDYADATALTEACRGAACVVSALNGLAPVILDVQGRLLDAAVAAGVPRFIPSDFSLDFTRTKPGDNRNLDLRRTFMARVDRTPIQATSILNGAFADLLTGQAPIVLKWPRKILYWGDADLPFDFTAQDDIARYTASAALDTQAPRILRIAGDVVTARDLAALMSEITGQAFHLWRAGDIRRLGRIIRIVKRLSPRSDAVFPVWQGLQYLRDMAEGLGRLHPLDNDRYGVRTWTSARQVLAAGT